MEVVHTKILIKGKPGFDLGQNLSCGRTFKIEDAKCISLIENFYRLWVIDWIQAGVINSAAVILFHHFQGIPDDGQAPVAQDIYLDQARFLHRILFPLEHLGAAGRNLYRAVSAYLIRNYHEPAAVGGKVIEISLELDSSTQDLIPGFLEFNPPHFWVT